MKEIGIDLSHGTMSSRSAEFRRVRDEIRISFQQLAQSIREEDSWQSKYDMAKKKHGNPAVSHSDNRLNLSFVAKAIRPSFVWCCRHGANRMTHLPQRSSLPASHAIRWVRSGKCHPLPDIFRNIRGAEEEEKKAYKPYRYGTAVSESGFSYADDYDAWK